MLPRFSLYDFMAGVIPGVFFLWSIGTVLDVKSVKDALPLTGGLAQTSVIIVVGYVTGVLLQGVSQVIVENLLLLAWGGFPSARWLLPEDTRLSREYKHQLSEATNRCFGVALESQPPKNTKQERKARLKRNQEIFYRCYRFVAKFSELPQTFNAQYGLFRALFTTFVILTLLSLALLIRHFYVFNDLRTEYLGFGATATLAAILSYFRLKKRADDFAKAVLDVFLVNNQSQPRM